MLVDTLYGPEVYTVDAELPPVVCPDCQHQQQSSQDALHMTPEDKIVADDNYEVECEKCGGHFLIKAELKLQFGTII